MKIRRPKVSKRRARASRWFYKGYVQPVSAEEYEAAQHHAVGAAEKPEIDEGAGSKDASSS